MKYSLLFIIILTTNIYGVGQEVRNLTFECLDDPSAGGKVFQPEIFSDSLQMSIKTHGPCKAQLDVKVIKLSGGSVIGFEVTDKANMYKGGKLKCGCHYRLQFTVLNYNHPSNFMGWTISNKTVPRKIWEEWYWNNVD